MNFKIQKSTLSYTTFFLLSVLITLSTILFLRFVLLEYIDENNEIAVFLFFTFLFTTAPLLIYIGKNAVYHFFVFNLKLFSVIPVAARISLFALSIIPVRVIYTILLPENGLKPLWLLEIIVIVFWGIPVSAFIAIASETLEHFFKKFFIN